jgi:hypothetical protein
MAYYIIGYSPKKNVGSPWIVARNGILILEFRRDSLAAGLTKVIRRLKTY